MLKQKLHSFLGLFKLDSLTNEALKFIAPISNISAFMDYVIENSHQHSNSFLSGQLNAFFVSTQFQQIPFSSLPRAEIRIFMLSQEP